MILSILGLGISGLVFQELRFSKTYFRLVTSLPIASAALKKVFYDRQKDSTLVFDTWDELSQEVQVELTEDCAYRYFFVDKSKAADNPEIIDESALINLNLASATILARLPGMDEDLAKAIVNSGLRPFSTINEVLLVKELTRDKFLLFKDSVTVYGMGKVNVNTVSKPVLVALGLDEETAEIVLSFRRQHEIKPVAKEPAKGIFDEPEPEVKADPIYGISSTSTLLNDLREFASLGLRQEQDILALLPHLTVKSEYLRFNVIPTSGRQEGLHYRIVVQPQANKVFSWEEQ